MTYLLEGSLEQVATGSEYFDFYPLYTADSHP